MFGVPRRDLAVLLVAATAAALSCPCAEVVGEAKKPPQALAPADFWIGKGDFDELLNELGTAITAREKEYAPEEDQSKTYFDNCVKSGGDYRVARYLWQSDPARARVEILKRFQATRYSTTRWLLCKPLCQCPDESVLSALKNAWQREKHTPYRFGLLSAYVECSAWIRLTTYSDACSDEHSAHLGEFGGGTPAINNCANLATRELARMLGEGPSVSEKDGGLDLDRRGAERWRAWFAENGPYLRFDHLRGTFRVDKVAQACTVPVKDWDRLYPEKQRELAEKAGRPMPFEIPGETAARKVERLVSYLEKGASFVDRRSAAVRLGRMGAEAVSAIPALEKRMKEDESQSVREAVKAAVDQLKDVAKDK